MGTILELIQGGEERHYATGDVVMEEGASNGAIYFLVEGTVEVLKDGAHMARASVPGTAFGDVSALLDHACFVTVRALQPCTFRVIADPRAFLAESPLVGLHLCETMARRFETVVKYLVDVRQQYGGDDHLGMIGSVLETLMHRGPAGRIRPSESTIRQGQPLD